MLQPDGKEAPCSPISGNGLVGPWAAAVDGDDNVWISSFGPATAGIVQLCGANPKAWPPGKKMGDAISPPGGYVGGGMQMLIDIAVDPAGNVWVDNNWQNIDAALTGLPNPCPLSVPVKAWWCSTDWPSRSARRSSGRCNNPSPKAAGNFSSETNFNSLTT